MTTVPTTNAMATEAKIAKIICRHFSSLMYSSKGQVKKELLLKIAMPMAAPSKENTNATVVDVGNPSVLKVSSKMMFATITAKNSSMTSWKVNISGSMTPFRATAIIPLEKHAPRMTPMAATQTV